MSVFIAATEDEVISNVTERHCRIGKVTPKPSRCYSWRRWFAWHPVYIVDRWYWLTYVARDQYANKPALYRYGRYVKANPTTGK